MVLLEEVTVEKSMTQETDIMDEVLIIGLEMKSILRQIANVFWTLEHNLKQIQETTYPQMILSNT